MSKTPGDAPILFREFNGSGEETHVYYKNGSSKTVRNRGGEGLKHFFMSVFLPTGYPSSVSSDYAEYQLWDTLQAFCSSLSGSLATRAVLKGVGVGDESATPLSATLTWLSRSGTGMLGQIAFAFYKSQELDANPKKWRLFADVLNDVSMALEIGASYLPSYMFSILACIASVFRSLVGVAGGATRTAITQHQARSNNISDVAAKDGSQETLVNLIGLLLNLSILPLIPEDPSIVIFLFLILTTLHLIANRAGVKSLIFDTFNRERLAYVLRHYFDGQIISSPRETNVQESLFLSHERQHCYQYSVYLGVSAMNHVNSILSNEDDLSRSGFLIIKDQSLRKIDVILTSKKVDLIHVYFEVFKQIQFQGFNNVTYEDFCRDALNAGWSLDKAQILTLGYRIDFAKHKKL